MTSSEALQAVVSDIDAARELLQETRRDIAALDAELAGVAMGGPVGRLERKINQLIARERGLQHRLRELESDRSQAERAELIAQYDEALQAAADALRDTAAIDRELLELTNSIRHQRAELKRRRNRAINAHAANVERARAISRGQAATDPALAHELQNLREKYLA